MDRKVEACALCTQQCLSLHGNKKKSQPVVVSFFKVMIGDFSRFLYLPPKFGPTVANLLDKKTILEDSSRKQWEVTVSFVNGSFAFWEGWDAFSLEHGLKVGNFLVFNYIKGSHFVVRIFDSSGCEKFDFPKNRSQKKRSRSKNDSATKDGKLHRKGSNTSVFSEQDVEIMQNPHKEVIVEGVMQNLHKEVIVEGAQNNTEKTSECDNSERGDQDLGDREREDRGPLTDEVISFEIWNNSGDAECSQLDQECRVSEVDTTVCNEDSVLDGMMSLPGTSEFEFTVRNNNTQVRDESGIVGDCRDKSSEHNVVTCTGQLREKKENNFIRPIREVPKCQFAEGSGNDEAAISKRKHNFHVGSSQNAENKCNPLESLDAPINHGEMAKEIKKEHLGMASGSFKVIERGRGQSSCAKSKGHGEILKTVKAEPRGRGQSSCAKSKGHGEILKTVKAEPSDCGNSFQNIATLSCVVPNNDDSLELPTCLPSTKRQRLNMERTVVYLKDRRGRPWPVLYHEHSNLKLLHAGWQAFSRVNNIKPGDECIFGLENESQHIFTVDVIRK